MEILFDNKKVEVLFNDFALMAKKKGQVITKAIKKRVTELKAAETFADFLCTRLGNPHRLKGERDKTYAINITRNIRLIVKPEVEGMDCESLKKCKQVTIKGAEDYHGDKITTYIP